MEKNKINYWKLSSIVLLIFVLGFIINYEMKKDKINVLDINGVNIEDKYLNNFMKIAEKENMEYFAITNLETNKSVSLKRNKLPNN